MYVIFPFHPLIFFKGLAHSARQLVAIERNQQSLSANVIAFRDLPPFLEFLIPTFTFRSQE